jgi:hypothetical protein
MSCGHRVVGITNGHSIHAGPLKGLEFLSIYLYLSCFCVRACSGNLSWQYVNSMNWIVCLGDGDIGGCVCFGAPITHRMFGLSLV